MADNWRDLFKFRIFWGGGEFGIHIGWVWIAIIAASIWWAV
jgi:hypothetical protein